MARNSGFEDKIMMKSFRKQQLGFTLIELMITVVVVAILAAIAYPAYTEQIAKGRRAEAQATLLASQQWMERFYSENYRYDQNTASPVATLVADLFVTRFSRSPASGAGAAMYNIAVSAPSPGNTFKITATRTGNMAQDRCGDFTVDHLGRRGITGITYPSKAGTNLTEAMTYCWK